MAEPKPAGGPECGVCARTEPRRKRPAATAGRRAGAGEHDGPGPGGSGSRAERARPGVRAAGRPRLAGGQGGASRPGRRRRCRPGARRHGHGVRGRARVGQCGGPHRRRQGHRAAVGVVRRRARSHPAGHGARAGGGGGRDGPPGPAGRLGGVGGARHRVHVVLPHQRRLRPDIHVLPARVQPQRSRPVDRPSRPGTAPPGRTGRYRRAGHGPGLPRRAHPTDHPARPPSQYSPAGRRDGVSERGRAGRVGRHSPRPSRRSRHRGRPRAPLLTWGRKPD